MAQTVHWDIIHKIWSDHLMIGLRPAQMAAAIVDLSPIKLATYIGVDFRTGPTEDGFPSRSRGVPSAGRGFKL